MNQYPGLTIIRVPFEQDRFINVFLLTGTRSLLVDTGIAGTARESILPALDKLPVPGTHPDIVVNLHAHADHIGGNAELFSAWREMVRFAAHKEDAHAIEDHIILARRVYHLDTMPAIRKLLQRTGACVPVGIRLTDGDTLSLGDRDIHVLHAPGHTPGNISLWDAKNRLLIQGESVMGAPIQDNDGLLPAMFGTNPLAYRKTLERLDALDFRTFLSSHRDPMNATQAHAFIAETRYSLDRFIQTVNVSLVSADASRTGLPEQVAKRGGYRLDADLRRQVEALASAHGHTDSPRIRSTAA